MCLPHCTMNTGISLCTTCLPTVPCILVPTPPLNSAPGYTPYYTLHPSLHTHTHCTTRRSSSPSAPWPQALLLHHTSQALHASGTPTLQATSCCTASPPWTEKGKPERREDWRTGRAERPQLKPLWDMCRLPVGRPCFILNCVALTFPFLCFCIDITH